jgi:hypothetical protein
VLVALVFSNLSLSVFFSFCFFGVCFRFNDTSSGAGQGTAAAVVNDTSSGAGQGTAAAVVNDTSSGAGQGTAAAVVNERFLGPKQESIDGYRNRCCTGILTDSDERLVK